MRVQALLRPLVRTAVAIVDKVRFLAAASGGAGLWLWAVLFYPFAGFGQGWRLGLALVVLVLLVLPAGVLLLFWAGLRELIGMPDRLVEMAGQGEDRAGDLLESATDTAEPRRYRRAWRFFRSLIDLRGLLLDSKALLLQFTVVARVANPVFIGALLAAFVLSGLLILAAAVALLVVIF